MYFLQKNFEKNWGTVSRILAHYTWLESLQVIKKLDFFSNMSNFISGSIRVSISILIIFYQYSLQVMVLSIRYIGCATTKYPTCFILSLLSRQNHQRPTKYLDLCLWFLIYENRKETQLYSGIGNLVLGILWKVSTFFEKQQVEKK